MPTLVIHGTADKTVPIDATGRVVAAQVPGAQLIEYDGSAHGLFATDKDRLIADLVAFLTGTHHRHRPRRLRPRPGRTQRDPAGPGGLEESADQTLTVASGLTRGDEDGDCSS